MIVLDASAAVDWLLQTPAGQRIETRIYSRNETLHAPHLLDLEVTQVLRRLALQGVIPVRRAGQAVLWKDKTADHSAYQFESGRGQRVTQDCPRIQ
jgi:predicted nucleic acid-binding protein